MNRRSFFAFLAGAPIVMAAIATSSKVSNDGRLAFVGERGPEMIIPVTGLPLYDPRHREFLRITSVGGNMMFWGERVTFAAGHTLA